MNISLIGCAAAVLLTACARGPQAPAPVAGPLDPSRLVARTDSFTILIGGQPRGGMRGELARDGDGWRYTETSSLPPMMQQETVVRFGATGEMRSLQQSGSMGGRPMRIQLRYTDGRVVGEALTPSAPKPVLSDTTVPKDAIDDNALQAVVSAMRFDRFETIRVSVYSSGRASLSPAVYTRQGVDTVEFGGQQVAAWRVLEETQGQRSVLHVATTAPYLLLGRTVQGSPFALRRER
ncbi:MAG: hypothetical protein SFW08_01550 [Gemmatimonadaceae bacterium]|nr:hypothetical protein [Gemmatimonadaceae bacterium]